jgi:hypothetical protein
LQREPNASQRVERAFREIQRNRRAESESAIKPRADFHEARHLLLDAQTNIAVDGVCPCVVAVKTKGRLRE